MASDYGNDRLSLEFTSAANSWNRSGMFVTCHHSREVVVMNSTALNPFSQMFDMAAVLAAHERAGEHAAVTCRVVRPLGEDRLDRMDRAAMEADICFGTDEDVDDGRFVQA